MKKLLAIGLLFFPLWVSAECWIASNLKGHSAYNTSNYQFKKNGIDNASFKINIDSKNPNVALVNDPLNGMTGLTYYMMSPRNIVGVFIDGNKSTIESWVITNDSKLLYTKTINDMGPARMSGTTAFIGDIIGLC